MTTQVLDIGSGDQPLLRANVLCDLNPKDSSERGGPIHRDGRPFIVCDAQYLPFKDKSFTFASCSHVLEHLSNPELGVKELRRVTKKGYIETPTAVREMLSRWSFHKWVVKYRQGKLLFLPNNFPTHNLPHFLSAKFLFWRLVYGALDEIFPFFALRVYFDGRDLRRL